MPRDDRVANGEAQTPASVASHAFGGEIGVEHAGKVSWWNTNSLVFESDMDEISVSEKRRIACFRGREIVSRDREVSTFGHHLFGINNDI